MVNANFKNYRNNVCKGEPVEYLHLELAQNARRIRLLHYNWKCNYVLNNKLKLN